MNDGDSIAAFQNDDEMQPQNDFGNLNINTYTNPEPQTADPAKAQLPEPSANDFFGPSPESVQTQLEEKLERERLVTRLHRLHIDNKLGNIQFNANDTLENLRRIDKMATHAGRSRVTIDMMKRAILFIAMAAEEATKRFPNKYVDLEGYGSYLRSQIDSYNDLFYDIFEYYAETFTAASPVITLVFALGTNAAMYSVQRTMLKAMSKPSSSPNPKREQPSAESDSISSESGDEEEIDDNEEEMQYSEDDSDDNDEENFDDSMLDAESFHTFAMQHLSKNKGKPNLDLIAEENEEDLRGAEIMELDAKQEQKEPEPKQQEEKEEKDKRSQKVLEINKTIKLDLDSSSVSSAATDA